jgi:hypothetical protein
MQVSDSEDLAVILDKQDDVFHWIDISKYNMEEP